MKYMRKGFAVGLLAASLLFVSSGRAQAHPRFGFGLFIAPPAIGVPVPPIPYPAPYAYPDPYPYYGYPGYNYPGYYFPGYRGYYGGFGRGYGRGFGRFHRR